MRKSYKFLESKTPVELIVKAYCPNKWILIDQETGQVYRGSSKGYWDILDPAIKEK